MTEPLLIGADVEQLLCDWLPESLAAQGLPGVPVSTRRLTGRSVTLYATGGPGRITRVTDQAQITFDVRDQYEHGAWELMAVTRALLFLLGDGAVLGGLMVLGVDELARPANLPDPDYSGARYRWSCYLHTRAAVR